ncbi:MAG: cytochrome c peroxidase [Arenicella sp.]|jgi:cytochrome c peroxidase
MRSWTVVLFWLVAISTITNAKEDSASLKHIRLAPGDDKTAYQDASYKTNSLSLPMRLGQAAKLHEIAKTPQLGLPTLPKKLLADIDKNKIALGRKLFFDRRLSHNKTMSCAMCHIPEQGFTSNELARPVGFEGRAIKRNAPTILNIVFASRLFWDARENQLVQQAWSPLLASNEMNNASIGVVIDTIKGDSEYLSLFDKAFQQTPDMINIGEAIAQYERSLIAGNSRFDQWLYAQQEDALSKQEIAGYRLFIGKAACSSCHTINANDALFTDQDLHNTGLGYSNSMAKPADTVTVQLAPGITAQMKQSVIQTVGGIKKNDLGRYEVTTRPADRWKFKTPSLRNVELTAPYMHDGSFKSLSDVVAFYSRGGIKHSLLSPLIRPLNLNLQQQNQIVSFLKTLTGSDVRTLVADGLAAPIGDTIAE